MKSVFDQNDVAEIISRIEKLTPETQPLWGKMNVAQMLGHCNVSYEMAYEDTHPKPGSIKRFILKLLIKPGVVNENPYPKNSPTAPQFKGMGERDFETEKGRLMAYITRPWNWDPIIFKEESPIPSGRSPRRNGTIHSTSTWIITYNNLASDFTSETLS